MYLRIRLNGAHALIATGCSISPDTLLINALETMVGRGAVTVS